MVKMYGKQFLLAHDALTGKVTRDEAVGKVFHPDTTASELRGLQGDAAKYIASFHKDLTNAVNNIGDDTKGVEGQNQTEALERILIAALSARVSRTKARLASAGVPINTEEVEKSDTVP